MARNRSFVRGAAAISKSRLTTWFEFKPIDILMAAIDTAVLGFSLNVAALALRPFTVVRSHFYLSLRSDQAAVQESQAIGFGLAVVSDQSVAIGVTVVPTPISDLGSNMWFVHQLLFGQESGLVDTAVGPYNVEVDSKAMRKVEVGQDIIVVAETASLGLGSILRVGGRMLVKNN